LAERCNGARKTYQPDEGIPIMKKFLAALMAAALLGASAAQAADPFDRMSEAFNEPQSEYAYSWTGFYIGAQAGGINVHTELNASLNDDEESYNLFNLDGLGGTGGIAGLIAGYRLQYQGWVVGIEGYYNVSNASTDLTIGEAPYGGKISAELDGKWGGDLQLGHVFANNRLLIYGLVGLNRNSYSLHADSEKLGSKEITSVSGGGGIDYAFTRNWSVGVKYEHDFGKDISLIDDDGFDLNAKPTQDIVWINSKLKF
jgi:outer membrane immunogenic protein